MLHIYNSVHTKNSSKITGLFFIILNASLENEAHFDLLQLILHHITSYVS